MISIVTFYSPKRGEINKFLSNFYNTNMNIEQNLKWKKEFKNPVEISEIIGAYIDNCDKYDIFLWISLDDNIYINITQKNANDVIKYLYERYPY